MCETLDEIAKIGNIVRFLRPSLVDLVGQDSFFSMFIFVILGQPRELSEGTRHGSNENLSQPSSTWCPPYAFDYSSYLQPSRTTIMENPFSCRV